MRSNTISTLAVCALLGIAIMACSGNSTTEEKTETQEPSPNVVVAQNPSLSPEFPVDGPTESTQPAFDEFSWQMFVAMNWPVDGSQRGVPDKNKSLGAAGPVVWSTFKTSDETFLEDGANPGPWNNGSVTTTKTLTSTSKVPSNLLQHLSSVNQAVGGPLTDQNGNVVYYEKLLNETEYNYILDKSYYDNKVLSALTRALLLPDFSMEIKAAWKVLTDTDRKDRFYHIEAILGNDSTPKTVGLVGLHIIYKTPNSPQWIWATFEQVDNVSGENGNAGEPYSFNNPNCSTQDCPPNQKTPEGTPTQLTRLTKIRSTADSVNSVWQGKVQGSVWEHYQLISTQWPTDPMNPGNPSGSPTPNVVANITMESYIQPVSSCMGCHGTARTTGGRNVTTDMSFLFLEAQSSNQ